MRSQHASPSSTVCTNSTRPWIIYTAVVGGGAITCGAPMPATGGAVPRNTDGTAQWSPFCRLEP